MPRKYEPVIVYENTWAYGDDLPYAKMKESPDGKWVPLEVFVNATAQLRAENERLKRLLNTIYGDSNA